MSDGQPESLSTLTLAAAGLQEKLRETSEDLRASHLTFLDMSRKVEAGRPGSVCVMERLNNLMRLPNHVLARGGMTAASLHVL